MEDFFVIYDNVTAEFLKNYGNESDKWEWHPYCNEDDDFNGNVLKPSAKFSTLYEAKSACVDVKNTFELNGVPSNEIDFKVLKIKPKQTIEYIVSNV